MTDTQNSTLGGASRPPSVEEERERLVPIIKEFRKSVDALIEKSTRHPTSAVSGSICFHGYGAPLTTQAEDQVRLKLTEAKMWAGKMLEGLGNPFPAELADKANVQ
jgi:hypothetical protein